MSGLRRVAWTGLFAVAMAYVEAAVVVYLRAIYYPDGFRFPIKLFSDALSGVELGREAATLAMLLGLAVLAGSDKWERFLCFCLAFGVWDVFYYVWLEVFIGWPPSLTTWDILFLIPLPWIGPVLAPLLVSIAMIACSLAMLHFKDRGARLAFGPLPWTLAIAGGVLVLCSFILDYRVALDGRMPPPFRWGLFGAGMAAALAGFAAAVRRMRGAGRPSASSS